MKPNPELERRLREVLAEQPTVEQDAAFETAWKFETRREPPTPPPLPPNRRRGSSPAMEPSSDLASRVGRLELGFCAAVVLIFSAIIGSYLLLAPKIEATTVAASDIRGDIKVLNERTVTIDKKLDGIDAKIDRLPQGK